MNEMVPSGNDANLTVGIDNRKAIAGINEVITAFTRMSNTTQNQAARMSTSFSNMTKWITKAGVALASYFASRAIYNSISMLLDRLIEVNRVFTGFVATMNVVKGSTSKAREEYQFLLALSNKLGVSVETTTATYARLAASLKNVDKEGELTRHLFSAISQAAVVLHSKGRDVHLIFEAFQQMASKGKLSLEELQRQLGNTLPGAVGLAARAMQMSEAELRNSIQKGTINVYEFLAKVANQIKLEYGGSVDYAAKQFTARMNVMKNAVFELYRVAGDSGAMTGMIRMVDAVTSKLGDPNLGVALGQSIGFIADQIADLIENIETAQVEEFFLAIAGGFQAVGLAVQGSTSLIGEFTGSFTGPSVTPMLDSIEFISNGFLGLVDVFTFVLRQVKYMINSMIEMISALGNALFTLPDLAMKIQGGIAGMLPDALDFGAGSRNAYADFRAPLQNWQTERAAATDATSASILDPLQNGNVMRNRMYFQGLRDQLANQQRNRAPVGSPFGIDKYMAPMDHDSLMGMIGGFPDPTATGGKPKGGKTDAQRLADNFARESIKLIKARSQAETELANVQANRFEQEGKFEAQTRLLLETDADFIKLSSEKQAELIGLAKQADDAALALERLRAVQEYSNETLRESYSIQKKVSELQSSNYANQFGEADRIRQSFLRGGENEFLDGASRSQMLGSATNRDNDARTLAMEEFAAATRIANDELSFQTSLIGLSANEMDKVQEFRKIDLWVIQQSVGATDEQIKKLQEMAAVLKNDVSAALDEVAARQANIGAGIVDGMQQWLDSTADVAGAFQSVTVNAIEGLSQAFTDFIMTGKADFEEFANSILAQITKIAIETMILAPFLEGLKGSMGGMGATTGTATAGGGGAGGWFNSIGAWIGGLFGGGSAKGNLFHHGNMMAFAKGGLTNGSTMFPMANGKIGLMGEAGPEAIMPLARDSSGRLGVRAQTGGRGNTTNIAINVQPRTEYRHAEQIANETRHVLERSQRRS